MIKVILAMIAAVGLIVSGGCAGKTPVEPDRTISPRG